MVGLLAWLQNVPHYLIVLVMMATFALIFFGMNQLRLFRGKQKKVDLEKFVLGVLYNSGVTLKKEQDEKAIFTFATTDIKGQVIVVAQPKDDPSFTMLGSRFEIAVEDQALLDKVTNRPESTVVEDLKIEMARFGVMYEGFRFCRVGDGVWGLAEGGLVPVETSKPKGKKKKSKPTSSK